MKLSGSVKHGADIHSLPFNPETLPGFAVAPPSLTVMRRATALMNLSEAPEHSLWMSELANYISITVSGMSRVV